MKQICLIVLACLTAACVFRHVDVREVAPIDGTNIESPVKAHLTDGSTVVYATGVRVVGNTLRGRGTRYDVTLSVPTQVIEISLDDVVGMESFTTDTDVVVSVLASAGAAVGATFGTAALLVAIFGSCPTVYSADGGVLEAELFSSSLAPLFEARDVDRLSARADDAGTVRLEVRNEAMETHYINHLELLEVSHAQDEVVVPDQQGRPVVVSGFYSPEASRNRAGHDLSAVLKATDADDYRSTSERIDQVTADDLDDWIDMTVAVEPGAREVALVFRLRNSLFSTVLLYDFMLGRAGARAIDWLGRDLAHIGRVVEIGQWHQRRAGLHVSVRRDGAREPVARITDSGPISWHDVAVTVPVRPGETSLDIRLRFLADYWRIDRVAVASRVRPAAPRVVSLGRVTGPHGQPEPGALQSLGAPDGHYLKTTPGQRFIAHFEAGPSGDLRTFLLSSQGYYTEWIRGEWIRRTPASSAETFRPADDTLVAALREWGARRDAFETEFMTARVPVR